MRISEAPYNDEGFAQLFKGDNGASIRILTPVSWEEMSEEDQELYNSRAENYLSVAIPRRRQR